MLAKSKRQLHDIPCLVTWRDGRYKAGKNSANTRQIDLDLDRTFPTNYMFETQDGEMVVALKRVLTAFSWHHPKIGYCQVGSTPLTRCSARNAA